MRVLVTGASGFLAPYVGTALKKSGCHVRVDRAEPAPFAHECVPLSRQGELADWEPVVHDVDAVVHLAARAHRGPARQRVEQDTYRRANVENTVNLANACVRAGAKHFVFLSSVAVHGRTTDERPPFSEGDAPNPTTLYAQTKIEAERRLAELMEDRGLRLTIVRSPAIYGRSPKGALAKLTLALRCRIPLPLASVTNRRAFVAAENLADFISFQLHHGKTSETFIVADDEQVSTTDFVRLLAKGLNIRPNLFGFPTPALAALLERAGYSHVADSLLRSLEVDTTKARMTGWRPKLSLAHALTRLREPS